jgi:hypothetical protein
VIGLGDHTTVLDIAAGAKLSQTGLVHVQRSRPDGIATG